MPFKSSEPGEPLHLDSLGPCPTTVREWVEQCERTGILEFPLLLAITEETTQVPIDHKNLSHLISTAQLVLKNLPSGDPDPLTTNARELAEIFLVFANRSINPQTSSASTHTRMNEAALDKLKKPC